MAQAIWADEFARSVPDIEEDDDEELWHVRMSSDEVKVLSLTRLDDLFRLSLVDAETLVWQPGMKNWVQLGVVAGIEDDSAPTTVPRPPAPRPLEPFGMVSAPQPLPVIPKPPAPVAITYTPESVRPITVNHVYSAQEGGGFGRFVLVMAALAGLAVTLYRNDVVRTVAQSAQLGAAYTKLEQALGGPSFGTTQSLDRFSAAAALSLPEALAPASKPAPAEAPQAATPEPAAAAAPATPQKGAESSPAVVSLDSLPLEKASAAKPVEPADASAAATPKAAPGGKAAAKAEEPEKPRTLKDAIRASVVSQPAKPKKARKRGASDFDPLNSNL